MKKSTFFDAFYKNAGYIAVLLISLAYIGGSFILISKTGKSPYEILATGALSMLVGLLINGVFRSIGIERGEADEKTIKTAKLYSEAVEEIVPKIDRLDEFCHQESVRALAGIRAKILAKEGLRYVDCFDNDGVCLPFDTDLYSEEEIERARGIKRQKMIKQNKRRAHAYQRAAYVKIKPLTPASLTSEGTRENDPFNFGKSKKEYSTKKNVGDALSRILMAIIFGYFGVTFVSEINPAALIWNTLQIVMYITSGVMQMYSSYSFIVDEHRLSIIKKIDYLQKFKLWVEKTPPKASIND